MRSASNRSATRHQDAAARPSPATTADRLIGAAQALEAAAKHLKHRAARLRAGYALHGTSVDDLGWGRSDIQTGYYNALSALEGEGEST